MPPRKTQLFAFVGTRPANFSHVGYARSRRTLRITRPPKPLLLMTTVVSRVACMRLFGGDSTSRPRGARHPHHLRLPSTTGESHHAPLARRNWFSLLPEAACQSFTSVIRDKPPNARHHPPPGPIAGG